MVYLKFSKNCLNVSMVQQLQFHFCQLFLHHNQLPQHQHYKFSCNTCLVFKKFRSRKKRITWFIAVIIPQAACCFLEFLLYSSKLYIGITKSKSSALSICTPLIFEIHLINGALCLNVTTLFLFASLD